MTTRVNGPAYGEQMASYLHLKEASTLILPCSNRTQITITRLQLSGSESSLVMTCIPAEPAFVIPVLISATSAHHSEMWAGAKYTQVDHWEPGSTVIYDLEQSLKLRFNGGFDSVHYHLPRTTLDGFTDENGLVRVHALDCEQGAVDQTLHRMTQLILPSLEEGATTCNLFMDYFHLMLCAHVINRYSALAAPVMHYKGGLAPWQMRRVAEVLKGNLDGQVRLLGLAQHCGLSVSHFARSFKQSFGTSVHRHLLTLRIEEAKHLLSYSPSSLPTIALQAGFSDQAAFSRCFGMLVGTSPGKWRRERVSRRRLESVPTDYPLNSVSRRSLENAFSC